MKIIDQTTHNGTLYNIYVDIEKINGKYNSIFKIKKIQSFNCPHCKRQLVKSCVSGYDFQCLYCLEDFYQFETLQDGEILPQKYDFCYKAIAHIKGAAT